MNFPNDHSHLNHYSQVSKIKLTEDLFLRKLKEVIIKFHLKFNKQVVLLADEYNKFIAANIENPTTITKHKRNLMLSDKISNTLYSQIRFHYWHFKIY
ncbi:MAG: hypothetical protein RMJ36_07125 [Candidatus Calescibacterium sp.]|nr:hypothetical protein [Candidatus Calescibacterium sp.]MDW8133406.1 hypothetical protein [Candidatus Calescibacterium sp.]